VDDQTLSTTPEAAPPLARRVMMPKPWMTRVLFGINIAVYLGMVLNGVSPTEPNNAQLLKWGAMWGPYSLGGQPWRMLTSNYVHVGIIHLGLNMWCLWNLGQLGEFIFGPWTLLIVYTLCGLGGSVCSLWWHPMSIGAGASGAIFGLAGALIAALYLGKLPFPKHAFQGTLRSLLAFAGYNLVFGAAWGRIDNAAHMGGLITGLLLGAVLGQFLMTHPDSRRSWEWLTFGAAAVLLFVAARFVKQSRGYVVALVRGSEAIEKGNLDEGIAQLQGAVGRDPRNNAALVLLGNAYLQQKNYAQAEQVLKRAQANDAADLAVQYNLGLLYQSTGRFEPAREIFAKLTRENPKDDDAWVMLGSSLDGLGETDKALSAYQRAVELNPKNAEAWRELGIAQMKLDQKDAAISSLQKALQLNPQNFAMRRMLARAYLANGDAAQAQAVMNKDPGPPASAQSPQH